MSIVLTPQRLASIRKPAVFGLSAALSRAGGILAVPIAAQALSLEYLGYYAICIAFIQLLCQFLSLGGAVAVAKAGAESVDEARALAARFSLVAAGLGAFVFGSSLLVNHWLGLVTGFIALISALEAHQQLYQLVIRAQEREGVFLLTSAIKAFAWPAALLAYLFLVHQGRADIELELLLGFQLGVYASVSAIFLVSVGLRCSLGAVNFRAAVVLSVPMVLHAFAQWVMSSADRVILGEFTSGETLALYSLAYSLASIMFVIVSGMALYLPHEIMRNVSRWGDPTFRLRFIRWYAAAYVVSFALLIAAYGFDYSVTNLLRYRHPDMFLVLGIVGAAFLFTGVYHVYVPFLFAAGRTALVTRQTLKACAIYLIAIVPLIQLFSAVGAAIGTLIVWLYYMMSIRSHATSYLAEQGSSDVRRGEEVRVVSIAAFGCCLLSIAFWLFLAF